MKMLVEIFADGYETEEEQRLACREIIEEWCDSAAVSTKVLWDDSQTKEELLAKI